jgi:hypothetical protein
MSPLPGPFEAVAQSLGAQVFNVSGCSNAQRQHRMAVRAMGPDRKIRYVAQCELCSWIDPEALDGWADAAAKEALSPRAARIAVATETEPFAFVQSSTEELPLAEIVAQALAAVQKVGIEQGLNASDGKRLTQIYRALMGEIEAALERTIARTEKRVAEDLY